MNDQAPPFVGENKAAVDELLDSPSARPWYRQRRTLIVGAALGLVLILLLSRMFSSEAGANYASEPLKRGSLTVTVSATGNLQPTNEVEVGSEQSGLVTQVFVNNNDTVTKGQPLARLDTSRLSDTLAQNRASVAVAEAQVATANATMVQARGNLSRQEEVYRLSGGKVPSKLEIDNARAEYQRGVAGVRSAQAQVSQAQAVLSTAQTNLSKATIYSPVNGIVLSRQIEPGQTVAATLSAPTLFTIAENLATMKLEVKVDEADVGQVKAGQRATFTVDAFPGRTFPATITRIDVGANASEDSGSTTSTVVSYTASLAVSNSDGSLRPGMTATAEIVTEEQKNQYLVPNAALRFTPDPADAAGTGSGGVASVILPSRPGGDGDAKSATIGRGSRQAIYVIGDDGKPRAIVVTTGSTNGSLTAVSGKGLRAGLKVITGKLAAAE